MKFLTTTFLFLLITNLFAQDIEIFQDRTKYEGEEYPSYSIYLEPDTKEVKEELKDYMKNKYDIKLKGIGFLSNKDVMYAEEVKVKAISEKEMDFFAKVVKKDGRTKLSFFGAYGYDIPVGPDQDYQAFYRMRDVLAAFINDYLPDYYTDQVKDVQEEVDDYRDNKKDLQEDIADNENDIEKKLEEIQDLRKENEKLSKELSDTISKLNSSESELQKVKYELDKVNAQLKSNSDNK